VVSGRHDMSPAGGAEALEQLWLRHKLSAMVADEYAAAGFTVVLQDVIIGRYLQQIVEVIRTRPLAVAVLCPDALAVVAREAERPKSGYGADRFDVESLDRIFREETPHLGVWIDS